MVRHIKALAIASGALLDGILSMAAPSHAHAHAHETASDDTQPIDVLVRNAFRGDAQYEADVSRVWSELSSRVMGPFGTLALEGPAFSYAESGVAQLSHHGRDIAAASTDGSSSPSASDDVYSGVTYGGAGSHPMNLR